MKETLYTPVVSQEIIAELMAYERHIRGDYDYVIQIEPMPTPRPRSKIMTSRNKRRCKPYVLVYHDKDYTDYKNQISLILKDVKLGLKPYDYSMLFVTFWIPYPASTPNKRRVDRVKHRKKPDWDNYIKGFQDGMSDAGILIKGDGSISDGAIKKRMTTQPYGFISFNIL